MKKGSEVFIGIDTAKAHNAVAVAEAGRDGEVRYLGTFDNTPDAVAKLVRKLADRYETLHFCYEAGPTGYGLYRQILALGHACTVVAPSLIPRRPGDRVKTNRRDAQSLAGLLRAGELTAVWVPDETHEAVRDLVRTRAWRLRTTGASASTSPRSCYGTGAAMTARRAGVAATSGGSTANSLPIRRSGWPSRRC